MSPDVQKCLTAAKKAPEAVQQLAARFVKSEPDDARRLLAVWRLFEDARQKLEEELVSMALVEDSELRA